ncbi:Hypothetical predicted protein, partial [Pelobates cultripes]
PFLSILPALDPGTVEHISLLNKGAFSQGPHANKSIKGTPQRKVTLPTGPVHPDSFYKLALALPVASFTETLQDPQ